MAYALKFNGQGAYVDIPSLAVVSGDSLIFEIDAQPPAFLHCTLIDDTDAGNYLSIYYKADGLLHTEGMLEDFSMIRIDGVDKTLALDAVIDMTAGVFQVVEIVIANPLVANRLGGDYMGEYTYIGSLKSFKHKSAGEIVRDYDPSASNGTGSLLPDTIGANDGTFIGFPIDDSQWVYYYEPWNDITIAQDYGLTFINSGQSVSLPLVGAYSGTITYTDNTTLAISGTGTHTIDGTVPISIKYIETVDTTGSQYYDFNRTQGVAVPELLNGQDGTLVGFPTDSGYVRELSSNEIIGYALNAAGQTITLPMVGAYTGIVTYSDTTTAAISGSDNHVLDGTTPVVITKVIATDTVGSFDWDFTTGDIDTIPDLIGGNHATIVNAKTSGWMPIFDTQVFTSQDYPLLSSMVTGESDAGYITRYIGANSVGATISGFPTGLIIEDGEFTSTATLTTVGTTELRNMKMLDVDATGATGDVLIIDSEAQNVTG
jgi:hypothetical protein